MHICIFKMCVYILYMSIYTYTHICVYKHNKCQLNIKYVCVLEVYAMCVCVHTYTCIHTYMHVYLYTCVCVRAMCERKLLMQKEVTPEKNWGHHCLKLCHDKNKM